jgi:hypothetical protein
MKTRRYFEEISLRLEYLWWIEREMSFANEIRKNGQGIETKKKYQDVEMRKGQLRSKKDMK